MDRNTFKEVARAIEVVASREGGVDRNYYLTEDGAAHLVAYREGGVDRNRVVLGGDTKKVESPPARGGVDRNRRGHVPVCVRGGRLPQGGLDRNRYSTVMTPKGAIAYCERGLDRNAPRYGCGPSIHQRRRFRVAPTRWSDTPFANRRRRLG